MGWAGDLQSLCNDAYDVTGSSSSYDTFYNYISSNIGKGENNSKFSMADLCADLDAVYINSHYKSQLTTTGPRQLGLLLLDYYNNSTLCQSRFSYFVESIGLTNLYAETEYYLRPGVFANDSFVTSWALILEHKLSASQYSAASHAFNDYILARR